MSMIEMEVCMDYSECEGKIHRALSNIEGVHSVGVDIKNQKVNVSGYVDEMSVLEVVRNATDKRVELWAYPYSNEYNPYATHYYQQQSNTYSLATYGYGQNNGIVQDCYESRTTSSPSSYSLMDEKAATLFNDENPNACTLM